MAKTQEIALKPLGQPRKIDLAEEMERLQVLGGVAEYPSRVKCATLAWHTLNAALEGAKEASSE